MPYTDAELASAMIEHSMIGSTNANADKFSEYRTELMGDMHTSVSALVPMLVQAQRDAIEAAYKASMANLLAASRARLAAEDARLAQLEADLAAGTKVVNATEAQPLP